MNAGVTEEAAQTARSVVDAMKSTPVILAVVIFNVLFMLLIAWLSYHNGQRFERMMELTLKSCAAADEKK